MSVVVAQKTVDLAITTRDGKWSGHLFTGNPPDKNNEKLLRLHYSLMGDTSPALSPLSLEYSFDEKTPAYRYDWLVGITPIKWKDIEGNEQWWNWWKEIRQQRALAVQLLIDCGQSGCGFSEISAMLLTLQPSKDSSSWLDRHADKLGESLGKLAEITQPINRRVTNILKVSSVMSNFIPSGEKGTKSWFIYRFLDEKKKCCAIEWNIHHKVLEQYGSVLRGSLMLTFHGTRSGKEPMTMLLRPKLGFQPQSEIAYVSMPEDLEKESPVMLSIGPVPPGTDR